MMLGWLVLAVAMLIGWLSYRWLIKAVSLTVFLIPTFLMRFEVLGLPTNLFEVLVVAVAVGTLLSHIRGHRWLARRAKSGEHLIKLKMVGQELPIWLKIWLGLGLISVVISTVISEQLSVSLGIVKGWIIVPIILAGLVLLSGKEARRQIITALELSGSAAAVFALIRVGRVARVAGWYDVPNSLTLWLAPILVLAVWRGLLGEKKHWWLAAPMAAALIASQSAAGVVAVLIVLLVGLVWWRRGKDLRKLVLATVLVIAVFIINGRAVYLVRPWIDGSNNSITVRGQLWRAGWKLIQDNPVLGVGLGQFEPYYQQWLHTEILDYNEYEIGVEPIREFVFRDPHNWILSFWLNLGILGLSSFVGVHAVVAKKALRNSAISGDKQAVLLALLALLLFGLVDAIYWKNDLAVLQWVLLALLIK